MQLDAYIRERNLSDGSFAAMLGDGVSAWAVRKWRYGQRIPRLAQQIKIAEVTGNLVTSNDLVAAATAADARRSAPAEASAA